SKLRPLAQAIIDGSIERQAAFRQLRDTALKNACAACLTLQQEPTSAPVSASEWAQQVRREMPAIMSRHINVLRQANEGRLHECRDELSKHEHASNRWQERSRTARDIFHAASAKAAQAQW